MDALHLALVEHEVEQTRARLARIIGAADEGLASVRRRSRMARRIAVAL